MSNDLAGSHEHASPGLDPSAQADGLPTDKLREAWAIELRGLEQSSTMIALAHGTGRIGGWLAALVGAEVINGQTYKALDAERSRVYDAASQRLLGLDQ